MRMTLLNPIFTGLIAAVFAVLPRMIQLYAMGRGWEGSTQAFWAEPWGIIGVTGAVLLLRRMGGADVSGRHYDGVADLVMHVHSPGERVSPWRWVGRTGSSFLLSLFGGVVGSEGAATEAAQSFNIFTRSRTSRWFEFRRRTDVAMALSAGVAGSFGAPFAAVMLPLELGIGGSSLMAGVSALTAFLFTKYLLGISAIGSFDVSGSLHGLQVLTWEGWLGVGLIGVLGGGLSAVLLICFRTARMTLKATFKKSKQNMVLLLAGGILLTVVYWAFPAGHLPPWMFLEKVMWSHWSLRDVALALLSQLLALMLVTSAWGSVGIFWPIFAMGSAFGFLAHLIALKSLSGFAPVAALVGASALFGGVIGAPFAGALLAFDLTQNLAVLLPCWLAGLIASAIRSALKRKPWTQDVLSDWGLALSEGRSEMVLNAIPVREAMVRDYEAILEHETVAEIHEKFLRCKYAVIPVVSREGKFKGLLSVDLVLDHWESKEESGAAQQPLSRLLEAKDLVYRSRLKSPTVRENDTLSAFHGMFEQLPCIPVVDEKGILQGLVFSSDIRVVYDREVARSSMIQEMSRR